VRAAGVSGDFDPCVDGAAAAGGEGEEGPECDHETHDAGTSPPPAAPPAAAAAPDAVQHAAAEHLYQRDQQAAAEHVIPLNETVEAYLIKNGLSGAALDGFIKLIGPNQSYTPSDTSSKNIIERLLQSEYGSGYEHIEISERLNLPPSAGPLFVSVHKDPVRLLSSIFGNADLNEDEWSLNYKENNSMGERTVSQAWEANRFKEVQVSCSPRQLPAPLLPTRLLPWWRAVQRSSMLALQAAGL
jgi:hypothetical protein